jgi:hypothetical protein
MSRTARKGSTPRSPVRATGAKARGGTSIVPSPAAIARSVIKRMNREAGQPASGASNGAAQGSPAAIAPAAPVASAPVTTATH